MGFKKTLVNLVLMGVLALGCSAVGAGIVKSFRNTERDMKIDKATKEIYNSWSEEKDESMRKQEIARIREKYASLSERDISHIKWGAGIGALTGILIYGGFKLMLSMPPSKDDHYDDGSSWSRTSGEYPIGLR